MAYQNQSDKEYATIDDVAKDDGSYNYLHISDVSPRSDSITHNTQEQYQEDVHHYQPLRKGPAREGPIQKSHKKASLLPWWGWLLTAIGISLLCVMATLLVVFLKGTPVGQFGDDVTSQKNPCSKAYIPLPRKTSCVGQFCIT